MIRSRRGCPVNWSVIVTGRVESDEVIFNCAPVIESIRDISPQNYVGGEIAIPDHYPAGVFLRELKQLEAKGEFPNLVII